MALQIVENVFSNHTTAIKILYCSLSEFFPTERSEFNFLSFFFASIVVYKMK